MDERFLPDILGSRINPNTPVYINEKWEYNGPKYVQIQAFLPSDYTHTRYVFLDQNKLWNDVLCIIVGQTIKKLVFTTAILDFAL